MLIKGFQKTTLIDYPEKIACTIFLHGCNFRCGFCHNPELVLTVSGATINSPADMSAFILQVQAIGDDIAIASLPVYIYTGNDVIGAIYVDDKKIGNNILFSDSQVKNVLFGKSFFLKEGEIATLKICITSAGEGRFALEQGQNNAYAVHSKKVLSTRALVGDQFFVSQTR